MTYQHQTERADATLACMERIENLLAAILATLVEQRGVGSRPPQQNTLQPTADQGVAAHGFAASLNTPPAPRIQLPPSYKGFTVPKGDKE